MREILFRGKRAINDDWVEGSLLLCNLNPAYAPQIMWYTEEGLMSVDVLPETVGQYTGLTDKNGAKIFEGDIVDCWSEGVNAQGTVQHRKDGMWIIYPAWQKIIMWGLCPNENCKTTVEVIGNIHDNPELIGGMEDGEKAD